MSNNYAVINGKRVELTDEQVKALGIEISKNPFERVADGDPYYYITTDCYIHSVHENYAQRDYDAYYNVNYFNDKNFAYQVAIHQLLYRKLLKFAYDNRFEDTAEWDGEIEHWCIYCENSHKKFDTTVHTCMNYSGVYFSSEKAAERAIKEVVEPFMKDHPDFVW